LALIFITSGTEKLLSPVENFIYALQSYELINNDFLLELIASTFPWLELLVGVFLLLGLWTDLCLLATGAMTCGFIGFVGQGILRKLPLIDCGCFGDLFHMPLWATFTLDWVILLFSVLLYVKLAKTKVLSLDSLLD